MSKPRSSPRRRPGPLPRNPRADWRSSISKEIKQSERLFVLGIGNERKGDDAAGTLCIRLLKRQLARRKFAAEDAPPESGARRGGLRKVPPSEFRVIDAGETPENLTSLIREFRPTHVLIVDAAVAGYRPGTIFLVDRRKIRREDVSTHRLPLSLLARYLEESIGCRAILVGIEPTEVTWGKPVSPEVREAATELAAWLTETLTGNRP